VTPRVSVGIPVYNGEAYLAKALRAIQSQTITDLEILIADNGSEDGTEAICRAAMGTDRRIRYLRSDVNRGGPWNMNRLYEMATSPLFKWAFYDDLCEDYLLAECLEVLDQYGPDHVLAHPRVRTIDELDNVTGEHDDSSLGLDHPSPHRRLSQLYTKNAEQALFGVIRTEALRRTRGIQRTVSDGHLLLTELILQGPFAPAPSQSLLLRFHPHQHGGDRAREMRWLGARRHDRIFAYTRTTGRLSAAVLRAPLNTREKIVCLGVVGRDWTLRTWRSSASDLKHLISDLRSTEADRTVIDRA
jgi:glycosyltransferase involved in cell wall biosynthesis